MTNAAKSLNLDQNIVYSKLLLFFWNCKKKLSKIGLINNRNKKVAYGKYIALNYKRIWALTLVSNLYISVIIYKSESQSKIILSKIFTIISTNQVFYN